MTVLLRPRASVGALTYYTAYTGVAIAEAIEMLFGGTVGIKWVNDCYVKGQKVAGILTETALVPGTDISEFVAIGIGVNLSQQSFPSELSGIAGTLHSLCPKRASKEALAEAIARALFTLPERDGREVMKSYRERSILVGKTVTVSAREGMREGIALDITDEGTLLVSFDNGAPVEISSGDVRVKIVGDDNESLQND